MDIPLDEKRLINNNVVLKKNGSFMTSTLQTRKGIGKIFELTSTFMKYATCKVTAHAHTLAYNPRYTPADYVEMKPFTTGLIIT